MNLTGLFNLENVTKFTMTSEQYNKSREQVNFPKFYMPYIWNFSFTNIDGTNWKGEGRKYGSGRRRDGKWWPSVTSIFFKFLQHS